MKIRLKGKLNSIESFPKILFLTEDYEPGLIYVDDNGESFIELVHLPTTNKGKRKLLGYQAFQYLIIYPQSPFQKVLTIFHELLHWFNMVTLDRNYLDKIIDRCF